MHDDVCAFTSWVTKIGSPTFYSWGLKSTHQAYNIQTFFRMIVSNVNFFLTNLILPKLQPSRIQLIELI